MPFPWTGKRLPPGSCPPCWPPRQAESPELVVRLSADEAVPYGRVAKLLARIREAGVERLAFRTRAP